MPNKQTKAYGLLVAVIIATLYHLGHAHYAVYVLEAEKNRLKRAFNTNLQQNRLTKDSAYYLKVLINNYESVQDKSIFNETDSVALRVGIERLVIVHSPVLHLYTPRFQIAILGPILLPIMSYIVKNTLGSLKKYKRIGNKNGF